MARRRSLAALAPALAVLASSATAGAQNYRMPATVEQWDLFYPTAYKDHAGVDWGCGDIRYDGHQGSDFGGGGFAGMDEGRDIVAAADGEVIATHDGEFDRCTGECTDGGYGNYVQLLHADGKTTIYGHLKQWSVAVEVGQTVACGDLLGQMGSSGNSTGPHLHFEVRNTSNVAEDPFWGDCSNPPSYWVEQWRYDELPMPYCDGALPPCTPVDLLGCGDAVDARNDGDGSTSDHLIYGCGEFAYTGAERAYQVMTDRDEPITISLTGLGADLDLFVLTGASCAGQDCLAASTESDTGDEQLVFDATAGPAYLVVVDGFERAASDYHLAVSCAGSLPVVDAGPSGPDGGELEVDGGTGGGAGGGVAGGCGCSAPGDSGSSIPVALMVLLAVGRPRRRATLAMDADLHRVPHRIHLGHSVLPLVRRRSGGRQRTDRAT